VALELIIKCGQLGLISGDMFAIDGCKLPSIASKEWSGTLGEFKKKVAKLEKLLAKIIKQQEENDKSDVLDKLNKTCKEYIKDKEKGKRHRERIEKKIAKIENFLKIIDAEGNEREREEKLGASGQPINSNITDNESALIKGPHGYIQGYNGIAIADSKSQVIVAAEAEVRKANLWGGSGNGELTWDARFAQGKYASHYRKRRSA
jgi:hypothetical protein